MGSIRSFVRVTMSAVSLLTVLALTSCGLPGASSPASTLTQGGDFPSLHRLNWGFAYVDSFAWSPDGKWIAMRAGAHVATLHLEVMSSDGHTRYDLSDWGCGDLPTDYSFTWLADNTLICATNDDKIISGTAPFNSPTTTFMSPRLNPFDIGVTGTSVPGTLIVGSHTTIADPVDITFSQLYAVTLQGVVTNQPLTSNPTGVDDPAWQPHGDSITYIVQDSPQSPKQDLVRSMVSQTPHGLVLQPGVVLARDVDYEYAWSPDGHWVAVRYLSYTGGDRIYLVNPDNPSQTVDVVLADLVGKQMDHPVWSPDGNTLIVTSVGYDIAYPYSLDIGSYLRSKGLQP